MPLSRPRAALASLLFVAALATGCSDDDASGEEPTSQSDVAVETLVTAGVTQLQAGDVAGATGSFNSVLALHAENVLAHYNLGLIAQQADDTATALAHYDAALAADGGYGPALYNKAILLEKTDLAAAVSLYRKAVEAQPEFAPAHMRLGFALVHRGETEEGESHLEKGLALDPSMADVTAPDYS